MQPIRINKFLRDQGVASRREIDSLIAAGKILVNGKRAEPGMLVSTKDDIRIAEGGMKEYVYRAYFKPKGLPTQGEKKEPSVVSQWKKQGLYPVGRLDKESEGLLILTNDGRATEHILDGDRFEKEYLVHTAEKIREGIPSILVKGMKTKTFGTVLPAEGEIVGDRAMLVTLHQGKHHQIRVMFAELGLTVTALKRVRIGHIRLGTLRSGESRPLSEKEWRPFLNS